MEIHLGNEFFLEGGELQVLAMTLPVKSKKNKIFSSIEMPLAT
jgi:hypothetical protein